MPPATVWVIEDSDSYRTALAELIDEEVDFACPVAAPSCEEALEALARGEVPDIVLMDIGLPGINGIEGTRRFRELSPTTRVLMLTVHEERDTVFEAILAGASGYLLKSSSEDRVITALRQVRAGGAPLNAHIARKILETFGRLGQLPDYGLTPRESEILQLMVKGLKMQQIADRLFVSYHTIDTHIRNIYAKLHVHTRSGAVAKALKEGLA